MARRFLLRRAFFRWVARRTTVWAFVFSSVPRGRFSRHDPPRGDELGFPGGPNGGSRAARKSLPLSVRGQAALRSTGKWHRYIRVRARQQHALGPAEPNLGSADRILRGHESEASGCRQGLGRWLIPSGRGCGRVGWPSGLEAEANSGQGAGFCSGWLEEPPTRIPRAAQRAKEPHGRRRMRRRQWMRNRHPARPAILLSFAGSARPCRAASQAAEISAAGRKLRP